MRTLFNFISTLPKKVRRTRTKINGLKKYERTKTRKKIKGAKQLVLNVS